MVKKHCNGCSQTTWHNQSGKKGNEDRCVECGYPLVKTNNESKKFVAEFMYKRKRKQLGRLA